MTSSISVPEVESKAAAEAVGNGAIFTAPQAQPAHLAYVLVTPARNEAASIEQTIKSVVQQTVKPLKWVIVSDGSTDGTDELVKKYVEQYPWIELVRMPERKERHFAGKVHAFNAGYARLKGLTYDIIGNLDADITFGADYFDFLLARFAANPRLGVGGTPFQEDGRQYDYRFTSTDHVSGACQLFRRECFEEIGGYIPIKIGGIDLTAVLTARMKGWQTQSFVERTCTHHRTMGTATQPAWKVAFRGGRGDYMLGSHPLWEFCRCFYQMTRRPLLVGGVVRLAGFLLAMAARVEQPISPQLVRFRRGEQLQRLRKFFPSAGRTLILPSVSSLRHLLTKNMQRLFWIYLADVFEVTSSSKVRSAQPAIACEFVPITLSNYSRVAEFRDERRVKEYREKLACNEVGFFVESEGRVVASIWATHNATPKSACVRRYMPLQPNEALIHDIVTGDQFRGLGIGPFMVSQISTIFLNNLRVSRIIIDVSFKNRSSLKMMGKAGLSAHQRVLYVSALGGLLYHKVVKQLSARQSPMLESAQV